jgi:hypothetical protein
MIRERQLGYGQGGMLTGFCPVAFTTVQQGSPNRVRYTSRLFITGFFLGWKYCGSPVAASPGGPGSGLACRLVPARPGSFIHSYAARTRVCPQIFRAARPARLVRPIVVAPGRKVIVMDQISTARHQLENAAVLAQVLAASSQALDLLADACRDGQAGDRDLFAAYAFAATAVTEAQIAISAAPSLPDPDPARIQPAQSVPPDLKETSADALAGLARLLHARLSEAGSRARDAGDQIACTEAARQAGLISKLLAPDLRP